LKFYFNFERFAVHSMRISTPPRPPRRIAALPHLPTAA
jgi:hypothetical protein